MAVADLVKSTLGPKGMVSVYELFINFDFIVAECFCSLG